ncbi:hypothetical protein KCP70_12335 [Salmonella enterica subsp. enterica]|nr:hypothetical protein KCP70_12335 [Salmonella enterica subsp. enterica]
MRPAGWLSGDAGTRRHVLQKWIVQTDRVYFADVSFTVYWRVDFNDARVSEASSAADESAP